MAKVYMFRHQKAGIVTSHVFTSPPTSQQIAPIKAEVERLHGREGWGAVHEAELMGPEELPVFPERNGDGSTENVASPSIPAISAVGTVG